MFGKVEDLKTCKQMKKKNKVVPTGLPGVEMIRDSTTIFFTLSRASQLPYTTKNQELV